jgi:two-component system nitrate/nitrite sensor histidine kinase NarX
MGQVALVVENARLIAEVEYQTMIQERTRLAREIHDGLAQTLGFLKLQIAQMQNYLTQNELERLRQSADLCYETLSDAYQDARQAIDGLRISPTGDGLPGWLKQTSQEFKDLTGMPLLLEEIEVRSDLPPEIHAQLIRIVQEALSNVRKHARASAVWINCREVDDDLWIEVRDDGKGFSPEDVPGPSQHGLRGMRERAELVGADYQIISRPDEGTTVRVRLPLADVKRRSFGESRT